MYIMLNRVCETYLITALDNHPRKLSSRSIQYRVAIPISVPSIDDESKLIVHYGHALDYCRYC